MRTASHKRCKDMTLNVKTSVQVICFMLWIGLVFYQLSKPPAEPEPFPEQQEVMLPSRGIYNPELAAALDQDLRDYWQKPDLVMESLGDLNGLAVADVGCGEGYFTLALADAVGEGGKVYATDIQASVLEQLATRIPEDLQERVELIQADPEDTNVPVKVDLILLVQVLGEVPDQPGFLQQLKLIMHEDTRLAIIDSKHITDPAAGFTRPLNMYRLTEQLRSEGFEFAPEYRPEDYNFLPKQFFIILRLAESTTG